MGTAIAGLAAGPFIIRSLRRKELEVGDAIGVPFSDGRLSFFYQWKGCYDRFSVGRELNSSPRTVPIKIDLSNNTRSLPFRFLETWFTGKLDTPETATPGNMMQYAFIEGTISIGSGKIQVNIDTNDRRHMEIDVEASQKNGLPVTETVVVRPDGTRETIRAITTTNFRYDSDEQRYKTDVVEKEVVTPLITGQFAFVKQPWGLDVDNTYLTGRSAGGNELAMIFFARHVFSPLIRFPFPEHQVEMDKSFECPLDTRDYLSVSAISPNVSVAPPLSEAIYKNAACFNGIDSFYVISAYGSIESYRKYLRRQYDVYSERLKRGEMMTEDEQADTRAIFLEHAKRTEKMVARGFPNSKYYIDSKTGCVVGRDEYSIHMDIPYITGVKRTFECRDS